VRYTLRLTETLVVIAESALGPSHGDGPSIGDVMVAGWTPSDVPVFAAP
jgi:hypothetical protein